MFPVAFKPLVQVFCFCPSSVFHAFTQCPAQNESHQHSFLELKTLCIHHYAGGADFLSSSVTLHSHQLKSNQVPQTRDIGLDPCTNTQSDYSRAYFEVSMIWISLPCLQWFKSLKIRAMSFLCSFSLIHFYIFHTQRVANSY